MFVSCCPCFDWELILFLFGILVLVNCSVDVLVVAKQCLLYIKDFQFLLLCQQAGAQGARRDRSQERWLKLAKGIFHTTGNHAQYMNCGELSSMGQSLLGNSVGISPEDSEELCCGSPVFLVVIPLSISLLSSFLLLLL